jgi:hypothetical protein
MMAIDHSDASALVDVRRTSSAAVRRAAATAVSAIARQQALAVGELDVWPVVGIDEQLHPRSVEALLEACFRRSVMGQEKQLPRSTLNARCHLGQPTFAGTHTRGGTRRKGSFAEAVYGSTHPNKIGFKSGFGCKSSQTGEAAPVGYERDDYRRVALSRLPKMEITHITRSASRYT